MSLIDTYYNEQQKLWYGPENVLFADATTSIGEVVYQALKADPTNICQTSHDNGKVLTNAETLTAAIRIAQFLKAEGLSHEDIVGIIAKSDIHVTDVLLACFFNTTPVHAVNPLLETSTIAALYGITKPKLIFCDGCNYELMKTLTKDWKPRIITLSDHIVNVLRIEELLKATNTENSYVPCKLVHGGDQTMAIVCSSGTTGLPKAVTLTNSQLLLISPTSGINDVVYTTASLDWLTAIKCLLSSILNGAARIVSSQPITTQLTVEIIKKWKVTYCYLSHWQFNELFASPLATTENLSSLQFVQYSGGWVSPGVVHSAKRVLESTIFVCVYGTTETDGISLCLNAEMENLVGALLPGISARIVSEQGVYLNHNEIGEILVKTTQNWNGYYGNPEQTAQTLDSDGWFHMGDLGYFDNDNQLYLIDRKKDLLKYKSMHYTPNEIEKIIIELPAVQQVCVVGIKDKFYGDAAGALIVRKAGCHLTEQQVINHVAKRISVHYKQLHAGVRFVNRIPVNFNGKLLRNVASEMFEDAKLPKAKL
ncbi:GH20051 [Drosophila grimshawi]|uniref:GH20051 n=2 Tax=Drosophila grimshawi TaxID=7222 RepID=B4J7L2_DROGR|nr:GH20051 [Drosophila grimshawi]